MSFFNKINGWLWFIFTFIGILYIYLTSTKDDVLKKVNKLEDEICDLEKEIANKKIEKDVFINEANLQNEAGKLLDDEISKLEKKSRKLNDKRNLMNDIFNKYGN